MLHAHDDCLGVDRDDAVHDAPGLLRQALLLLALGGLLAQALASVERTHRRRRQARPAPLPERLQTWEGEGGRPDPDPVPGVDAMPTPPHT